MQQGKVGLIGMGLLGGALAERLLQTGFEVSGYDLDPARRTELDCKGGLALTSARAVAESCTRLVLSLPTSDVVTAVIRELDDALLPGHCLVDMTTGDPERTASRGSELADRGVDYVDATVAGSSDQVRVGDVVVLLGGQPLVAEACADLLASFAREWFYLGAWGSGARMKLVVNLVLGLQRAVLAEGLAFGRALGFDPGQTLKILQAGPTWSRVMDTKGRKMIDRDFQPQARLAQHLKDVALILAEAERVGATVPLSRLHRELLTQLDRAGFGAEDNAAIVRAFD